MYQDKNLTCQDCGASFVFPADKQEFFAQKGYADPKRCLDCVKKNKESRGDRPAGASFPAVCDSCKKETTVPFQPTAGKPVYCRDCFMDRKGSYSGARAA